MARLIRWAVAGQVPATQIPDAAQYPSAVVSVLAVLAQVHVPVAGVKAQQPAPVRGDRHLTGLSIVVGEPVLDRALNRERVAEAGRRATLRAPSGIRQPLVRFNWIRSGLRSVTRPPPSASPGQAGPLACASDGTDHCGTSTGYGFHSQGRP